MAGENPWGAWTLEWATTSPPPHGNFPRLPQVVSDRPLYDVEHGYEDEGGRIGKVEWHDVPPEPEQRTSAPFWVAVGMLILGVGLLGVPLVFIIGFALILITAAVWMNARWTEIAPTPPPPDVEQRFSFIGARHARSSSAPRRCSSPRSSPPRSTCASTTRRSAAAPGWRSRCRSSTPSILVASGVTAHYAQTAFRARRKGRFFFLLVLTIVLGVVFLGGQGYEYLHAGFGFADTVVDVVVLHPHGLPRLPRGLRHRGAHLPARSGRAVSCGARPASGTCRPPRPARRGMVDGATYYWHFVDAVWVFVFIVVYLL